MNTPAYKRVLLKLSGAFLAGRGDAGIDFEGAGRLCDDLARVHAMGVRLGIVIGGGNVLRGAQSGATELDRATRDYMGMLATVINGLALQGLLERRGVPTRVMSAIGIEPAVERYTRHGALNYLDSGQVVIFVAGTGHPFFTTDTAAALRGVEINAEILMKATDVDGVYDADPDERPDARRYDKLDYTTALRENLGVMDAAALSLCRDNSMPILVFDLTRADSIMKAVQGESSGTLIREN